MDKKPRNYQMEYYYRKKNAIRETWGEAQALQLMTLIRETPEAKLKDTLKEYVLENYKMTL